MFFQETTDTLTHLKKELYTYQKEDLEAIFERIEKKPPHYHLLYQLPTGGGKTVIFCEMTRRYIEQFGKKVWILTHRVELCKQTSGMLNSFGVKNKIITSDVKFLDVNDDNDCYVAMVETLKNRILDEKVVLEDVGLVIVDEAHFNSFRKLFSFFKNSFLLGVTATPLSSNAKLPMNENYQELLVGHPISYLVKNGYLAEPKTITFDVGLSTLKVGINGDYTIKSSDELYGSDEMQTKLVHAYQAYANGTKTLIFNSGIRASQQVKYTFEKLGFDIKHLDNTHTDEERRDILRWFKKTKNAILTSVSILTTGFDEPTVETIILNRATRSLTLYFQMIGRGSRRLPHKDTFNIIDLGNNTARFGYWTDPIPWQQIFKAPDLYLHTLKDDATIERHFKYKMPEVVKQRFPKTREFELDIETLHKNALAKLQRPKVVLEASIDQHAQMCVIEAETIQEAKALSLLLNDDIASRIRRYANCLGNCTRNYEEWLVEDYKHKLILRIGSLFREKAWALMED